MRLIDASYVLTALSTFTDTEHGNPHFLNGIKTAREIVNGAPTIEPEIIRCRDCKHWEGEPLNGKGYCHDTNGFDRWWNADDFCSYAERREGD